MDEKKLLDQIRQSASDLTPPESLNPDAIEKLLTQNQPAKPPKRKISVFYRLAGAAAVFALFAVSFWQIQKIQRSSAVLKEEMSENIVTRQADAGGADNSFSSAKEGSAGDSASADNSSDNADKNQNRVSGSGKETEESVQTGNDTAVLPAAQSYEEVYQALRDQFYYEDDIIYTDMGVLTSSVSGAAAIEEGGAAADIAMEDTADGSTMDIAMEDNSAMDIAMAAGDGASAENGTAAISMQDTAAGIAVEGAAADTAMAAGDGAFAEDSAADDSSAIKEEVPEGTLASAQTESARTTTGSAGADYSATNIQEFGVDEADIVKTDGQYIYILRRNGSVTIVDATDPRNLREVSTIPPAEPGLSGTDELYVDGDVLNVIAGRQTSSLEQNGDVYYPSSIHQTVLYTYDISDRAEPKLSGTVFQDGTYETSRKNGSFIYLFTSWYPDLKATYEESSIVPEVNGARLSTGEFYLPQSLMSSAYLLISSTDIRKPQNILDKKALVSGTSNFYVSPENIYIANELWNSDTTMTEIMKFHYEDGMITGTAAGTVKGYLNNSFSLNEYNGCLRVVSTYYDSSYEEQNGLYILDEALRVTGSIEDLAEGETIRSARFFGDIGYFVTFRQTDPLFSVDLSDPVAPTILGELKVSGFSSYLHFYGKDLLLGMGYEADETTGVTSGVKLSMFDISDPANVTELHRLVIPGVTWCPSIDNYKSILIDPQKNVFGFFCGDRYLVFSYDKEKGFVSELIYDFIEDALAGQNQTPEAGSASGESTYEISEIPDSLFRKITQSEPEEDLSTDTDSPVDITSSSEEDLSTDAISASEEDLSTDTISVPEEDLSTDAISASEEDLSGDTFSVPEEDLSMDTISASEEDLSADAASVPEFEITTSDSAYVPSVSADNTRGLYIGDTFYLAGDVSVLAFDMNDHYARLGNLSLTTP